MSGDVNQWICKNEWILMSQKSHLLELPHTSCLPLRLCMNFISVDWVIWRSVCFTYFQQMCVNFFRQKWFGSSCIYLRWYQSARTNYAFKKEVFLNRTQKRYHTEAAKLTARLHENGDITEKLVGRCHLQDNAPIIMTVMKWRIKSEVDAQSSLCVLRLYVESGW